MLRRKVRMVFLVFMVLLFFSNPNGISQFYETGQDPFPKTWKQINTEYFQILFPKEFEPEAQKLANILTCTYEYVSKTLDHQPRKVTVIIHNETFYSNGTVIWAPKRMEIFTTPPQDICPTDWLEQLAIHEFRHVVQIDKMNQGITKILSFIMGEQATGLVLGLIPMWFFEGDAVVTETALTLSGRGSLPSFDMPLRAIELENTKRYAYEKAVFGSYKDYVPNHYYYGYQMVGYGRIHYGPQLWSHTLDYVAKNPFTLYPFYFGLRKSAGLSKNKLYHETFDYLRKEWASQLIRDDYSEFELINKRKNDDYTNYEFPCFLNDSTLLVSCSGLSKYNTFLTIDGKGNEKAILRPGMRDGVNLSAADDKIVWEEYLPDPRWENKSTSVIKIYDTKTRKYKTIDYKTRLFSPAITPNGSMIAAVDMGPDNRCALVFFDTRTGYIVRHEFSPENTYIQIPSWSKDGSTVLFTFMKQGEKGIGSYHFETAEWKVLLEPGYDDISHVTDGKDYIFFHATYSGIDNIYSLNKNTDELKQVTSSRYGAFYPCLSPREDYLYYSDYTGIGYSVVRSNLEPGTWIPVDSIHDRSTKLDELLRQQEEKSISYRDIPSDSFNVKPYRRYSHLLNIHSWLPFYFNYNDFQISWEGYEIHPGITLLSQDKLSTAFTRIGYAYHNDRHHIYSGFTYKGLYSVFEINAGYGGIPSVIPSEYTDSLAMSSGDYYYYLFNVYIPLNLTRGNYIARVQPHLQIYRENAYYRNSRANTYNNQVTLARFSFSAYRYRRTLPRDIFPRWGQAFFFQYSAAPFESQLIGHIRSLQTYLYLPGILKHQGLLVKGGMQIQRVDQYYYSPIISFTRGYGQTPNSERLYKISLDYGFPILYPDINIGRLAYIKRMKGNLFYDYTTFEEQECSTNRTQIIRYMYYAQSLGLELTTDIHLAHIIFPFEVGGRFIMLPDERDWDYKVELLFKIDTGIF